MHVLVIPPVFEILGKFLGHFLVTLYPLCLQVDGVMMGLDSLIYPDTISKLGIVLAARSVLDAF